MASWLEDLDEALASGAIGDSSVVVVLCRNIEVPLGSTDAWDVRPIVAIERDVDDIDLITDGSTETGMSVGELRVWLNRNADCGECELFVPEQWEEVPGDWNVRRDLPVIGPVLNAEASAFGVMAWYDGCDVELA